jgi:hypothetical protein
MNFPEVKILLQNGKLGRIDDEGNGIAGLIVLMANSPTGHAFGDVKTYSRFEDLPLEMQNVKALELYFKIASGYKAYIMPIANTVAISDALNPTYTTPYALNLIKAGNGEIRFIGIVGTLLNANLQTAITNAQALRTLLLADKNPIRTFLPYSYRSSDTPADLTQGSANGVGVVISYAGDEIGLLLGRLASTPVQRHPGRVKDGAMPITSAYLDGAAEILIEDGMATVKELHDKGYIVLGILLGKTGYYFMGMPMATANTDDYATIVNCRTIDKAYIIAYKTYLEELNEEVYITEDGKLQPGYVKAMQSAIENAIDLQMTGRGEISGRKAFFDDQQNVLSTSEIEGTLEIQPVGHSSVIIINLGLTKTV